MQTEQQGVTRTNLDLLRAVAVSLVLVDHTLTAAGHQVLHGWDLGWLGVFGVYLFFAHTCLVLMWSLERRPYTLDFYVRRVFRLYPLAVVVILGMVAFHLQMFGEPLTPKILVINLLLLNNLFGTPLVLFVLWSLLLEVQMYLLLPVLFLFARRERAIWPFLLFWALACRVSLVTLGRPQPVYPLLCNVPFFLPGILAFIGYKRHVARLPAGLFPVLVLVLALVFDSAPSVERGWLLTLGFGLLLPFFRENQSRPVIAVTHVLAKYSYGIYLLHPVVLMVLFAKLALPHLWQKLVLEALSLGTLSVLGYHLIEHPMMRLGSRVANRLQRRYGSGDQGRYGLNLA